MELDLKPKSAVRLRVEAEGYFAVAGSVTAPPSEGWVREISAWLLAQPVLARGVVLGADGLPVPDARVRAGEAGIEEPWARDPRLRFPGGLRGWDEIEFLLRNAYVRSGAAIAAWEALGETVVRSDRSGGYELALFPRLRCGVFASHPHRFPSSRSSASVTPGADAPRLPDLVLGDPGAAALSVGIEPPEGVRVTDLVAYLHARKAEKLFAERFPRFETALQLLQSLEAGGREVHQVEMQGLPPGEADLFLIPEGVVVRPSQQRVLLAPNETATLTVSLEGARPLEGVVTDPGGRAFPLALVRATFASPPLPKLKPAGDPGAWQFLWRVRGGPPRTPEGDLPADVTIGTRVDRVGRFHLAGLPEDGALVEVFLYGQTVWRGRAKPTDRLEIRASAERPDLIVLIRVPAIGTAPDGSHFLRRRDRGRWSVEVWDRGERVGQQLVSENEPAVFRRLPAGGVTVVARGGERWDYGRMLAVAGVTVQPGGLDVIEVEPREEAWVHLAAADEETGELVPGRVWAQLAENLWDHFDLRPEPTRILAPSGPGVELRLEAKGFEPRAIPVHLEPAEHLDLGDVCLRRVPGGAGRRR